VQVFAECHILPSAALDKAGLCRVPEIWHSVKIFALGKSRVSRSGSDPVMCARDLDIGTMHVWAN